MQNNNKGLFRPAFDMLFGKISLVFSAFSDLFQDGFVNMVSLFIKSKDRSKNIIGTNLELASMHFKNGNYFDARLRYWIVTKFDKKNFDGYLGLAYVFYVQNKYSKAIEYFTKAREFSGSRLAEIDAIIDDIKAKHS